MRGERHGLVDPRRRAIADDRAFKDRDELTIREVVDLITDLAGAVVFNSGLGAADQREHAGYVG